MNNNNRKNQNKNSKKTENDHIPRYIKEQPWYYKDGQKQKVNSNIEKESGKEDDYLLHHRQNRVGKNGLDINNNSDAKIGTGIDDTFDKVIVRNYKNKRDNNQKICSNCGSAGHLAKDCLERPSKLAKHANTTSDNNDIISIRGKNAENDYDAKQDRWFGFQWKDDNEVMKNWETKQKKLTLANKSANDFDTNESAEWDTDEEIELFKLGLYKDEMGIIKQDDAKGNGIKMASVRLREDKANYLRDINSEDTKYDPKSRIYKDTSIGEVDEKSNMFRRHLTGEGLKFEELNKFSREQARKEGIKDEEKNPDKLKHVLIANPTKYEQMLKQENNDTKVNNTKTKTIQYKDLQATKLKGKQNKKTKKTLADLYE